MYRYKKNKKVKPSKFFTLIIIMVLVSVATILIYNIYLNIDLTENLYGQNSDKIERMATSQNTTELGSTGNDPEDMLEIVTEAVVGISKIKNIGNSIFSSNNAQELGLGSGFIVAEDGYIMTNWHVVGDKYSSCYVTIETGKVYNGSVIWANSDLDLAVVKIAAKGLKYVNLGDSDHIRVGQKVYAIGNPIGFEFQKTVTYGIISGVDRTIKLEEDGNSYYMEDLIQTDATINPGNSGGPLILENGDIIGINTVKITTAEGIGFAIPINIIKPIIEKLVKGDGFEESYLGIYGFDKEVIPYLDSNLEFHSGIYVAQINANGPCSNTNIKIGDILTMIDNIELNKMTELRSYIYTKKPGEKVKLKLLRNNKEIEVEITLGKLS